MIHYIYEMYIAYGQIMSSKLNTSSFKFINTCIAF